MGQHLYVNSYFFSLRPPEALRGSGPDLRHRPWPVHSMTGPGPVHNMVGPEPIHALDGFGEQVHPFGEQVICRLLCQGPQAKPGARRRFAAMGGTQGAQGGPRGTPWG